MCGAAWLWSISFRYTVERRYTIAGGSPTSCWYNIHQLRPPYHHHHHHLCFTLAKTFNIIAIIFLLRSNGSPPLSRLLFLAESVCAPPPVATRSTEVENALLSMLFSAFFHKRKERQNRKSQVPRRVSVASAAVFRNVSLWHCSCECEHQRKSRDNHQKNDCSC